MSANRQASVTERAHAMFTIGLLGIISACSSTSAPPVEVVSAGAFREPALPDLSASGPAVEPADEPVASRTREPDEAIVVISAQEARGEHRGESQTAGEGLRSFAIPEGPIVIDAKIGDINGRAIYADAFLKEMETRFIQERSEYDTGEWLTRLGTEIDRKMKDLLREELLRAEALASLPEQQRTVGLNAVLDRMRGRLKSFNHGSATRARKNIAREMGEDASVDEFLARAQNEQLTQMILESQVKDRVNISWREIVQEYERSSDIFNPKPRAIFRWIRVDASDTASVADIARRLDAGEAFEKVAGIEANRNEPKNGGLRSALSIESTMAELLVFNDDVLNEAAVSLSEGEYAGPIETAVNGRVFANWVFLERVIRNSVPLYDAQVAIGEDREAEEINLELGRYLKRLQRRTSLTDMQQMHDRLMLIAIERFNPQAMAMYLTAIEKR